jgi:hypothetical protein
MLSVVSLLGCSATGSRFAPPAQVDSGHALIVVYRVSQVGGTASTWVPTRLEVNGTTAGKLPADSFLVLLVPVGDITLSATDMIDFRYSDTGRVTLRETVLSRETVYFRLLSVFGEDCKLIRDEAIAGATASSTRYPRPDWAQTTCFSRVPELVALKGLNGLRRAN